MVPDPNPIVAIYCQKWGVTRYEVIGRNRDRLIVNARIEIARSLWNIGFSARKIALVLRKDRTHVLYYLGLYKRAIGDREGITVMAKQKITSEDRAELLRLQKEGRYRASSKLAKKLGVSRNYGCVLAARNPKMAIPKRDQSKWAKARAVGPINV